jgi:signal transduction histidine kinase
MFSDPAALARQWRRVRNVLRTAMGIGCLFGQLLFLPPSPLVAIAAAVFVVYSLLGMAWRSAEALQESIPGLFLDAVFFAAYAAYGSDPNGWLSSFFFLFLMLSAVVSYDWAEVVILTGACMGFFAFVPPRHADLVRHVVLISGLLAFLLAYQKRKLQQWMRESQRREEDLRGDAESARDLERQRIAGDFHDGPLQSFIGMQVRLDILGTLLKRDPAAGMQELRELQALSKDIVGDVRSFLRSMRPAELDASDVVASARRIVEYFQKDTGIVSRFVCSDTSIKAPQESSHEMLQILREALHNVQKHSKASRVVVSLEQTGKAVELSVDDDGAGFAFSGSFNLDELDLLRLGPASIRRRVRSLGGELAIESRPGHGAGLRIRIPS